MPPRAPERLRQVGCSARNAVSAALARVALPIHRAQLEQMDETWDQLAEGRRKKARPKTTTLLISSNLLDMRENEGFDILHKSVPRTFQDKKDMVRLWE